MGLTTDPSLTLIARDIVDAIDRALADNEAGTEAAANATTAVERMHAHTDMTLDRWQIEALPTLMDRRFREPYATWIGRESR